jgi:hypothetical protein
MMKKLPKEKRDKVIMVWMLVVMAITAWYFVVLKWQLDVKASANNGLEKRRMQHEDMSSMLKMKDKITLEADEKGAALAALEAKMVNGDVFSWVNTAVREFKQGREVDIPQISQPNVADNQLLPKFPYRQATVTVAGTGFYHDIGMFIADFENQFKFARIINLDIEPISGVSNSPQEAGKLNFKMDIIFLVKPNQS